MRVRIVNNQNRLKPNLRALTALAGFFMARAARLNTQRLWREVVVVLTDHDGIAAYNQQCFGRNEETDVISLLYEPVPGQEGNGGEIIVNVERALELGPRFGGWERELALYVAHGCDHLSGACDDDSEGRARMRRRERRWIAAADRAGLLALAPHTRGTGTEGPSCS